MVASGQANLYASVASGICALWGPLLGGTASTVVENLILLSEKEVDAYSCIASIEAGDASATSLGLGGSLFSTLDPRTRVLKETCWELLHSLKTRDPVIDLALELEYTVLRDSYCIERKLYPNVAFYSGLILRAIGIPTNMFAVVTAIGCLPSWIAHWREVYLDPGSRIHRPRQIYTGSPHRSLPAFRTTIAMDAQT
jgi:citrate synthase